MLYHIKEFNMLCSQRSLFNDQSLSSLAQPLLFPCPSNIYIICWSTDCDVVCCPYLKNRSDRLLGSTIITFAITFAAWGTTIICSTLFVSRFVVPLMILILHHLITPLSHQRLLQYHPLSHHLKLLPTTMRMFACKRWNQHIQDSISTLESLPKKHYTRSKIPAIGHKVSTVYNYYISSIAIDYLNMFAKKKELGWGWKKPVNKTDSKNKISNILLALHKLDANGVYCFDQGHVLSICVG